MKVLTKNVIYHGRDEPLPQRVALQAGPVSLFYEEGDLRYLRLGSREIIRRIYVAVRDQNWGTVPAKLSNVDVVNRPDSFRVFYEAEHRQRSLHFTWKAEIVGEPSGRIVFTMDGHVRSTFLRNRIGFCVLHPMECAGAQARVERANDAGATLRFPKRVAPEQPLLGFTELAALAHEDTLGHRIELKFSGEFFEMEDQRNWIDASFKTYCTPLNRPRPVEVRAGERVLQQVAVEITGESKVDAAVTERDVEIAVDTTSSCALPKLGLGVSSLRQSLPETAKRRLGQLALAHLRADLDLSAPDWKKDFAIATAEAGALNLPLEVAVHLPKNGMVVWPELRMLLHQVRRGIARFLIFADGEKSTSARVLGLARQHLADFRVPIGAGTNADFYQLNQCRPPQTGADFVVWSMNPQVHAFDVASIAETPMAICAQIESAREYFPGKPLVVSPVTLKPRFNPVATGPEPPIPQGQLPPQVDPRQMSLFGAAWTLAAYKHLAEAALESVTFFETAGWRGVLERDEGSSLPQVFHSVARGVFPMFHFFADVAEFAGGKALKSTSSQPLAVKAIVLRKENRAAVLLANLTDTKQTMRISGVKSATQARILDESSADVAMREPETFRDRSRKAGSHIELPPFAYCRLDVDEQQG